MLLSQEKSPPVAGQVKGKSRHTGANSISESHGPVRLNLENEYLWEQTTGRSSGRYAYVPTLCLGCTLSREELSDEAFLADAKALVDDVTLLMSFARRQWIVWYHYTFWAPGLISWYQLHSSRDTSNQAHRRDDSPVGTEAAEFLRVCLPIFSGSSC